MDQQPPAKRTKAGNVSDQNQQAKAKDNEDGNLSKSTRKAMIDAMCVLLTNHNAPESGKVH